MTGNTVMYGLEITDLEPIVDEFGWTHTAYFDTMAEALEAAKPYVRAGTYRLVVTTEVFDYDNAWHTINREEVD